MKALCKSFSKEGLWLEDKPEPAIVNSDDVKIRIKKAAICGTDRHIWQWDDWAQASVKVPLTVGHEFVGEVVEIGSAVEGLALGERVSGEGHIPCNRCRNCLTGYAHICVKTQGVGVTRDGAFAEYIVIPYANVRRLPDAVSDEVGAILDPLGNAVHAALAFDVLGEDVLITGAGPIGCMATAVARFAGARHVVITDFSTERLALARSMGATHTVLVNEWDKTSVFDKLAIKEGFDVGVEMSGAASALDMIFDAVNANGNIALMGVFPQTISTNMNQAIFKGLTIKGIYGRRMFETWQQMLAMISQGLDVTPIISHEYDLSDFEQAFAVVNEGRGNKVLLNISD